MIAKIPRNDLNHLHVLSALGEDKGLRQTFIITVLANFPKYLLFGWCKGHQLRDFARDFKF